MKTDKPFKLKPLKDKDTVALSLFLKSLSWALPSLCLLGLIYGFKRGGSKGAVIGFFLCAFLSVGASLLTLFISDKFGDLAGFLYKGPKANWSIKERLEGSLNQVRYHKMNQRFPRALLKIEEVLAKDPNFSDALLLKAQILWEGFDEAIEAKRCLETIIKTTPKTDNHYQWASTFYADIVKEEKKRLDEKQEA